MDNNFEENLYCDYHQIDQSGTRHGSYARGVAQERRNQENEQFKRLASLLPVSPEIVQHLDKASIIRLAKTNIRLNEAMPHIKTNIYEPLIESNVISLMDGFLCIFSVPDFEFLYVSETISQHLGLSQVELCGNSFWNYIHDEDLPQVRMALGQLREGLLNNLFLNFRMRSTLTKRRNRDNPNCTAGYKVITMEINSPPSWSSILAFCQPHSVRVSNGVRIPQNSLVINTDDSLRITYVDVHDMQSNVKHLVGKSFYQLVHPEDLCMAIELHERVQVVGSHHTRFMRLTLDKRTMLVNAEIMAIRYSNKLGSKAEKTFGQNRITLLIMQ